MEIQERNPNAPQPRMPEKGFPQKEGPDMGPKQDQKYPEQPDERHARPRPEVDRPDQGDDREHRDNQSDGHDESPDKDWPSLNQ